MAVPGPVRPAVTSVFESNDLAAIEQVLSESCAGLRLSARGDEHWLRLVRTPLTAAAAVETITYSMRFQGGAPPFGRVAIGRVRSGTASFRAAGEGTDNRAGDVFVAGRPDAGSRFAVRDLDADVVHLEPELLARVAAPPPGRRPAPVRLTGLRPVSAEAAERWHTMLDYVLEALALDAAHNPLLAGNLARLLAATALSVFPNNAQADPPAEDRRDAHPGTLRRAVAFIDENAHRDISLADIAAAANVTIRTVQLAFRRHLDSTPLAYLRRARLEQAHRALSAADPSTASVGNVAARWGFINHSRFTAAYRTAYGRPPSATLRERDQR